MRQLFYLVAVTLSAASSLASETMSPYHDARNSLANILSEMYLFPEVGERYASAVRSNPVLDSIDSDKDFAAKATKLLQTIHPDGHLGVSVRSATDGVQPQTRKPPPAIEKAEMLTSEVAYLKLLHMPGDISTLNELYAFLNDIRGAKVLIIDVRRNFGGGLLEIDTLFSEIYAEETPLLYMDIRSKAEEQGYSSLEQTPQLQITDSSPPGIVRRLHSALPSPSPSLTNSRILALTSKQTPSAAEHLVLALKRTSRAELIGETTAGLGHFGETIRLNENLEVFVPIGETINPDTGEGWEGQGVSPDVEIPASQALTEALRLAGVE